MKHHKNLSLTNVLSFNSREMAHAETAGHLLFAIVNPDNCRSKPVDEPQQHEELRLVSRGGPKQ